jgi:DNA-directed RNA polymerase subunit RPC12/RpoP
MNPDGKTVCEKCGNRVNETINVKAKIKSYFVEPQVGYVCYKCWKLMFAMDA